MTENIFDQQDNALSDEPITFGDWVTLPFPHIVLHWWRGDTRLPTDDKTSVAAFGGWYCGSDKYYSALQSIGYEGELPMFSVTQLHGSNGPFEAVQAREIYVSYITHRFAWFKRDGKDKTGLDILCLLGRYEKSLKHFVPVFPVVLSGGGKAYTTSLQKAFKDWQNITAKARREHANGLGSSNFFFPVGTFGDTVNSETVSSKSNPNKKSNFVPVSMKTPDKQDYNLFKMLFIGHDRETLQIVKEYKELAKPWIDDFAVQAERSQQAELERDAVGAARYGNRNQTSQEVPESAPNEDDDIPF